MASIPTSFSPALGLGLAVLAAAVPGQRSALKNVLPADTIAFVTLPDIDTSIAQFMDMPLMRMWRQEELQSCLQPVMAMARQKWDELLEEAETAHQQGMLPFPPGDLLKLRLGGLTLALTKFRVHVEDNGRASPELGLLAHADFGASAGEWRKIIDFALQAMEDQAGGMLAKSTAEVGDVTVTTWRPDDPEAAHLSLNLAWVGNGIVVGTAHDEFVSTLQGMASGANTFNDQGNYKAVSSRLDLDGAEFEGFLDWERLYGTVMDVLRTAEAHAPRFPPELDTQRLDRALTAFGLKSIKAFGVSSTYRGNKAVSKAFMLSPAPERRGIIPSGAKNLDLGFLRWVPANATGCSASTFDLGSIYDAVVEAARAYDPEWAEQGLGQLARMEERVGLSLRSDLVGAFGNQIVSWSLPMTGIPGLGGSGVNGMWLVQVKDAERLLKCLQTFTKMSDGAVELGENERRGLKTYYLQVNINPFAGDLPFNPFELFTPTFAFEADYMVLGFSRSDVRKTVALMQSDEEREDIRSNKAFAEVLDKVDSDRLTSISFSDLATSFNNIYELAYGFTYMVPEDFPVDVQELPDQGSFLSQHLFPSVGYSHTDGNGFESTSVGPFGPEMIALGVAVGAAAGVAAGTMRRRFR